MPDSEARFAVPMDQMNPRAAAPTSRSGMELGGVPVVSVVMPARDAESTILQSIESVLNQSLREFELIVVDDGSRDGTLERVRSVRDARVQVVSTARNGLGAARNAGLARARGEYVAFVDADDLWTQDKLESHVEVLRRQPRAVFAYSWSVFIDAADRYLFAKRPIRLEGDVQRELLREYFLASGSNLFVRRAVALAVGGFDEHLEAAQDWDFALKVAAAGRFALVPRYQVLYRISPGALSSDAALSASACSQVVGRQRVMVPTAVRREGRRKIRGYEAFLLLTRSSADDFDRRARRLLLEQTSEDPGWLFTAEPWQLAAACIVCAVVPRRLRRRSVFGLMRLYGAWLRTVYPELREDLLAIRSSGSTSPSDGRTSLDLRGTAHGAAVHRAS